MSDASKKGNGQKEVTRRSFLKGAAVVAAAAGGILPASGTAKAAEHKAIKPPV